MNKLQKQLNERVKKDEQQCMELLLKENKESLINRSYQIATLFVFRDVLNYFIEALEYDLENEEFPLSDKEIETLLNYEENILEYFTEVWFDYSNPQEFMFWYNYYDVIEIIQDAIKQLEES